MNKAIRIQIAIAVMIVAGISWAAQRYFSEEPLSEIMQRTVAFQEWYHNTEPSDRTEDLIAAKLDEVLAGLSYENISDDDLDRLARFGGLSPKLKNTLEELLTPRMQDPGADGAWAALLGIHASGLSRGEASRVVAAFETLFDHPGFGAAFDEGRLNELPSMFGKLPDGSVGALTPRMEALARRYAESDLNRTRRKATEYLLTMHAYGDRVPRETRERLRQRLLEWTRGALAGAQGSEERRDLQRTIDVLESDHGKGMLLGQPASELTFVWSSDGSTRTLSDLRGKVVVLDFWATWCAPCIASFPSVRDLQEHYDGYEVVIVGVTNALDSTEFDDPDRDIPPYAERLGMTWMTVLAQERVFNPDYGINAIPHMAIIDPEGILRHNGLHPGIPLEQKTALIDPLLRAHGLDTPGEN